MLSTQASPQPISHIKYAFKRNIWLEGELSAAVIPLERYSAILSLVFTVCNMLLCAWWIFEGNSFSFWLHLFFAVSSALTYIAIRAGISMGLCFSALTLQITTAIWLATILTYPTSPLSLAFLFFLCPYYFVIRASVSTTIQALSLVLAFYTPALSNWIYAHSSSELGAVGFQSSSFLIFSLVFVVLCAYTRFYAQSHTLHSLMLLEKNEQLAASEQRLLQSEKQKNKFIADMNHELRTPLNAIVGIADIIRNQKLPPEEFNLLITQMQHSGDQLINIINDVLDLTRIHEQNLTTILKPMMLTAVLDHAAGVIKPLAQMKGIQLQNTYRIASEEMVFLDDKKLSQVIINLLGNAVKFSTQGCIRLELDASELHEKNSQSEQASIKYRIAIHDQGIGIESTFLPHIFDEFNQGSPSTHDQFGGSGLGLHISKKFIEHMGGRIWCESSLGKGSSFYIDLTLTKAPHPRDKSITGSLTPETTTRRLSTGPKEADPKETLLRLRPSMKIHIVDDNQLNLMVAQKVLASYYPSYETHILSDPSTLIAAMRGHPSDVILLDVNIPGHSTLSMVRLLRQTYPAIKVVAFTADSTFVQTNAWRLHGYHGVLLKPFKIEALTDLFLTFFTQQSQAAQPPI